MVKKVAILIGCILLFICCVAISITGAVLFITSQTKTVTTPTLESGNKVLDFRNQNLTTFKLYNYEDPTVSQLYLSHNNLNGSLPGEIRFLTNLEVLDLSYNAFTGVPAEVGQLKNLRVLNLSNNKLTGLPNELGNLSKLETLDVSGNNYSVQDLNAILQRLPPSVNVIK